jgi:hypothetical protein
MRVRNLIAAVLVLMFVQTTAAGAAKVKVRTILGAGTTIVAGGTGSPSFVPVITMIGIQWDGTQGTFDCLALAPSHTAGSSGSGNFDSNIMYVTGAIHTVSFNGDIATISGDADCTGLGAGIGVPFVATVQSGGPGARIVLMVSGLTFTETMFNGQITFN